MLMLFKEHSQDPDQNFYQKLCRKRKLIEDHGEISKGLPWMIEKLKLWRSNRAYTFDDKEVEDD